jgi:hypothetical protein
VINLVTLPKKFRRNPHFLLIATDEYIISRLAQDRTCLKDFPKATTVRAFWSRLALQRLMLLRGTTIIARSAIGFPNQAKAKSQ